MEKKTFSEIHAETKNLIESIEPIEKQISNNLNEMEEVFLAENNLNVGDFLAVEIYGDDECLFVITEGLKHRHRGTFNYILKEASKKTKKILQRGGIDFTLSDLWDCSWRKWRKVTD